MVFRHVPFSDLCGALWIDSQGCGEDEGRQRENGWDGPSCDNSEDASCVFFALVGLSSLINKPRVLRKYSGETTQVSRAHGCSQIHVAHPQSCPALIYRQRLGETYRHTCWGGGGGKGVSADCISRGAASKACAEWRNREEVINKGPEQGETKVWLKTVCVHQFYGSAMSNGRVSIERLSQQGCRVTTPLCYRRVRGHLPA